MFMEIIHSFAQDEEEYKNMKKADRLLFHSKILKVDRLIFANHYNVTKSSGTIFVHVQL